MQIKNEERYIDEESNAVEEYEISHSDYTHAILRRSGDDDLYVGVKKADGSEERYHFTLNNTQSIDVVYNDGDRRNLPDDVQDIMFHQGYCPLPNIAVGSRKE